MSELDKCRKVFEKKFGVVGTRLPNGNYSSWAHQMRWGAFKAAWNTLQTKVKQLKGQLERAGYTDNGGELMRPPLGKPPRFDLLDDLKNSLSEMAQKYRVEAHELSRIRDFEKSQMYSHFASELDRLNKGGA
ncbi:hypothetical protein [Acinetobacter oleivorans]|uniref:hypothetical protein n=1 Tax=Acinetobacter oleivorans TaxID=1148157 RepID=UPI00125EFD89|nr:hypothetical protein [Acinetobacter oleivorans]